MLSTRRIAVLQRALLRALKRGGLRFEEKDSFGLWRAEGQGVGRLVVIPGLGDSPFSWVQLLFPERRKLLARFSEIVFLDFPGAPGALADRPHLESIDRKFAWVDSILQELHPDVVMGHSLGAWLATKGAIELQKFGWKGHLVVINPSGVLLDDRDREKWKGIFLDAITRGFGAYRPLFFVKEPLWFPLLKGSIQEFFEKPELKAFVSSVQDRHLLNERISQIESPVSIVWSEKDQVNFSHWAHDWVKLIPHAKLYWLRGVGHTLHLEKPKATRELLIKVIS